METRTKYGFFFAILTFFGLILTTFLIETNYFNNFIITCLVIILLWIGLIIVAKKIHNQISDFPWFPTTKEEREESEKHDCELQLPIEEAYDRCILAFQMFKDVKIELSDKKNGIIKVVVPDRPFYNPESDLRQSVITITIHRLTKTKSLVNIVGIRAPGSPPLYGMNKKIVEKISMFLENPAINVDMEKTNVSSF